MTAETIIATGGVEGFSKILDQSLTLGVLVVACGVLVYALFSCRKDHKDERKTREDQAKFLLDTMIKTAESNTLLATAVSGLKDAVNKK